MLFTFARNSYVDRFTGHHITSHHITTECIAKPLCLISYLRTMQSHPHLSIAQLWARVCNLR